MKCIEIVSDEWRGFTVAIRSTQFSTVKQATKAESSGEFTVAGRIAA